MVRRSPREKTELGSFVNSAELTKVVPGSSDPHCVEVVP